MTTSPRGASDLVSAQAVPESTVNQNTRFTEAGACHFPVVNITTTAPPGSCTDGANYIIAATATGLWAGKEKSIATALGTNAANGWLYHVPIEGFTAYNQATNARYLYDGSAWGIDASGTGSGSITASGYTQSTAKLLGRTTAGTGAIEEISAGAGITLSGGSISASGGGGGGAAWALAGSWTYSTDVANVDFINLSTYDELLVVVRNVTTSASGVRRIQVSINNGSTFYNGASDYISVSDTGIESNAATPAIAYHSTSSTGGRTLIAHIRNLKGAVKVATYNNSTSAGSTNIFVGSASAIDAIRVDNHTGGNMTAGSIYVYGR